MTLYEQIKDFVSLGYRFEFSNEPLNMNIKVSWRGVSRNSWLPYSDHCDEKSMVKSITWMIDQIQVEENNKS